jgi:NAD(P)-dependent dehydrogenase (short-subunit alcohol dehydrogenase family)
MKIDLSDQRILVTGASRGIGRAIARQLSESGAEILLHCKSNLQSAEELSKDLPSPSHVVGCDLSKLSEVEGWLPELVHTYGKIDVLINNAGIAIHSPLDTQTHAWMLDWQRTMNVNLSAAAILCKEFIEGCNPAEGGRIINISSRAAHRGNLLPYMAYAASKAGLIAITKSLARHLGKQHIKAFTVAPGFVKTDMADSFKSKYGEEHLYSDIALDKLTEPEDIAPLVTFLCSGLADHATGSTFDLNAGSYLR